MSRFGEAFDTDDLPDGKEFGLRTARSSDAVWMALGGELDVYATPSLRAALRNVERTGPRLIVLDLRGLSFLDSSGLAVLLGAHERAAGDPSLTVKLVITGSTEVEHLFETLHADDFLDIVEDPVALAGAERG
jgi:anti-sigma B factor antagonist